ncbi:hypothetical protein VNO77_36598 [Canavalia gladiata]|uniref:Core Histone H2A/H2B/H3 domain-containing protein n=1 Tax=Canavalia gladiata TaxID=3824 RepID=A0AAN9K9A5_CANGL
MAPKRRERKVVRSTKKVVESSVKVSVVRSSSKRLREAKREIERGEEEHGKIIPIQEVSPHRQIENSKSEKEEVKSSKGYNGKVKRRKKRVEGYERYVYKVLKQVHPEMGISSKCMTVLNNLMNDMFERLAGEAAKLKDYTGHMTLSSREIQGAVKLLFPGELGKHAIAEGVKAVITYTSHHA